MLYDFLNIIKNSEISLWRQLYNSIEEALSEGRIVLGSRLPSIRELSKELEVSRSPVENAYLHLQMDGYIESRPKSGYFALTQPKITEDSDMSRRVDSLPRFRYDLSAGRIDAKTADIDIWRKHLRTALNMEEKIISFGDPQGEPELREALVEYCYTARRVRASAERIVIASGTQQLLTEFCRILGRGGSIAMERPGFVQGEQVFLDFGWDVSFLPDSDCSVGEKLKERGADLFADITSNRTHLSLSKLSRRRKEIVDWAVCNGSYVLEDDYNGELRYLSRPVPSLQGMSPERVVYIGSFSRLLLPSVRIAYMVLPEKLAQIARHNSRLYDQTSSKIEQLALAEYIRERHLERHIKRSRKTYQIKSMELLSALSDTFGKRAEYVLFETSLSVAVGLRCSTDGCTLVETAKNNGIQTDFLCPSEEGLPRVGLSFSGIPFGDIRPAINLLFEVWKRFII